MQKLNELLGHIKNIFEKINSSSFLNRTPSKKFLITVFSLVIVLIAVFSAVTVITEGEENETTTAASDSQSTEIMVSLAGNENELVGNFLLVLTRDGTEDINLLAVARLDSLNKMVSFSFLSPETACSVNGYDGTMQEHLKSGGINELLWAVGEYANISIERYVFGDEQNFVDLMKSIGDIEVNFSEKVSHAHNGIPFIIEEGLQSLTADMMLKYFVYLCDNLTSLHEKAIEMMVNFGKKMFDAEDDVIDSSFNNIIRNFNTNISVVDCTNYKAAVKNIASSEKITQVVIENDISLLK